MNVFKKYWVLIVAFLLVGLFLWLRFGNIQKSLFFFNDMGSDLLVLQDWIETGKPPLLGPQTSALPINQSPLYFYMLMPAFLIFKGAPVSLLYTNAFLYITSFVLGLWLLRRKLELQKLLLVVFFLITISPQYVIQSRFVWNPSFVTPFLVTGFISLYLLREKYSKLRLTIFSLSMAVAVSLSYSVAPAMIAAYIYLIFTWKKNRVRALIYQFVTLLIVNLPTIVFELRHKFLLTSMLFNRGASPQGAEEITAIAKFNNLFGYGLSISGTTLVLFTICLSLIILWFVLKNKDKQLVLFAKLLALLLMFTFIVPLAIHPHYVFGFTTLLFITIASLPKLPRLIILGVFALLYLTPSQINSYFRPARRTVDQMTSCFQQVCGEIKEPIFESVQAGYHPFHNGPEFRYLMKRNGCDVKYIENVPDGAKLMAVVVDDSSFESGVTSYNELSMFGKADEVKRFNCQENFQVVILEKSLN